MESKNWVQLCTHRTTSQPLSLLTRLIRVVQEGLAFELEDLKIEMCSVLL